MNSFGKALFDATSIAPLLVVCAAIASSHNKYAIAIGLAAVASGLTIACGLIVFGCSQMLPREPMHLTKVTPADKKLLVFLAAYLLPMIASSAFPVQGDIYTVATALLVAGFTMYRGHATGLNPLLVMGGYHFYDAVSVSGMPCLLVSKKIARRQECKFSVIGMADYVYLHVE